MKKCARNSINPYHCLISCRKMRILLAKTDGIRYNGSKETQDGQRALSARMGKRMRELAQIRQELDEIDREMVKLFERRMTLCREVARTKLAQGKPVLDASREAQVLESRAAMLTDASLVEAVQALYREMMALSRQEQEKLLREANHA